MKRLASELACLLLFATTLCAQVKPTLASEARPGIAPSDLPAARAFRTGLTATAALDGSPRAYNASTGFLQAVELRFPPYPGAEKYAVLRASSQKGVWMLDHEGRWLTVDSLKHLPPSTPVYARVVAMKQGPREGSWVALDTTNSTVTMTTRSLFPESGGVVGTAYVWITACQVTSPATVRITWLRTYGAAGYVVHPSLLTGTQLATIAVQDTVFVQANVAAGAYKYAIYARYDIPNWPEPGQTLTLYQAGGSSGEKYVSVGGPNNGCD